MALSGKLRELGPLELLQMIGLQRKSGLLRVRCGGRTLHLDIRQGQIAAAHPAEGRLERLLVALDLIEPQQAERAAMIAEGSGDDLIEVLMRAEGMEEGTLLPALALHAQSEVDFLLAQSDGLFELDTEAPAPRAPVAAGLSLERAIHEGVRRLDEVANLRSTRFTSDTILAPAPDAPPPLPGAAAHLRSLLQTPRAIPEILSASGLPPYETLTTLEEMAGAGLVAVSRETRAAAVVVVPRSEGLPPAGRMGGLIRVVAAFVAALGVRVLLASVPTAAPSGPVPFLEQSAYERREIAELTLALEIYRFESANYPLSLYYLADRRLVDRAGLEDSEGRLYDYELAAGGTAYLLHRSMQGEPRLSYPFVEKD